jgi:hypothetical protein
VTAAYKVRRVKGAHPARFVIVSIESALPDVFMKTSDALTEGELRALLKKDFGQTEPAEIDSLIEEAWRNPPI